jgi:alkylhydroperoxidase family enzyme
MTTQERIPPLEPPYDAELSEWLAKWMPPGVAAPPLRIFRTIARHRRLGERMRGLGAAILSKGALDPRDRELAILRTCARTGAEYEWGVHVAAFARPMGIDERTIAATRDANVDGVDARDALVLRAVDALHDRGRMEDALYAEVAARLDATQILELCALVGFYHAISYVVNVAGTEPEAWAARFDAAT